MGRLVQLELENFKSYRGHQVIGPFTSFTAVVGPNGAGKSNLMDAISFVLGVRSTHLRSSQLKDLVYRGRAVKGQSEGAVDEAGDQRGRRAWVRAVYDDGGRTVTFQRSIGDNGESEYRINNRVVSLSTYNQALEAQNILVKAKNFLVFQGDVEAVAAQSPKDLTRLIEQISGSWELQHEYSAHERRQDAAAERSTFAYNKKRAVAAEVQSIVEQKKELDTYESKLQQRTKLTELHMLHRLFVAESRIDAIKQEAEALDGGTIAQATEQRAEADASLQSQKKTQARAYKAVSRQERQIKLVEHKIETRQPRLVGLGERVTYAQRRREQIEENMERAQEDVVRQREVVVGIEQERGRVAEAEKTFESCQVGAALETGVQHSEETMSEFERLSEQLRSECAEDMHARDTQDQQIRLLGEAAKRAADRLASQQSQLVGLAASEHAGEQQRQRAAADVAAAEAALQQVRRDGDAARAERGRLERVEAELHEKLAGVLAQLAQARADQRESAREARLRDMVAALQRVFPGVHGRLAELCRPTQRKYDVSVATVLGRHMDAIVVDRQTTALECIRHIKEQRAGQATFLPLDTLKASSSDRLRHAVRGARPATDVLQYDTGIEAAVLHACGGALICDSLDAAKHACYELRLEAKAVTLDGSVIHRSGLITGGADSRGGQRAQAWESAAVDELRRARDRMAEELQVVARARRGLASEEVLSAQLAGQQARHRVAREVLEALDRKLQGAATERKHLERSVAECIPAVAHAETELEHATEARAAAAARIYSAARPLFATFCRSLGIADLEAFERQLLPAAEAVEERRMQFRTQLARLDSQLAFERQQLDEAVAKLARLTQTLADTRASLAEMQAALSSEQIEMAALVAQLDALRGELASLSSKYGAASEDVHAARQTLEHGRRELDTLSKSLAAKAAELERARAEKAAVLRKCKIEDITVPLQRGSLQALPLDAAISSTTAGTRLAESEFSQLSLGDTQVSSASLDAAADEIVPDYTALPHHARTGVPATVDQKYSEDIARLSVEIDALNPNPHARERLDAARERLREIESEHNAARQEARDAKTAFHAVRMRRHDVFMRCYNHLATAIDQAYKALTQSPLFPLGGTAYLALEDPESPYLAGVKYHAMPPLKRFRDMDQLSGGEKTVAALALLFALQTFRPAPFFVLDEVDAALDLANVAKLANFLRENARFIVISLKQALFERAQSLVGIYRDQSQNSSRVLTLDLEQFST
ncbi:RecF/RecN/SMC protein [Coemansia reversa NRRL 1564]|uniref:Structural maintenance of chromosomes protein n=1 Tax=Coemansia reversa (strain ATCC 12441 / NRRL 1564) TaxID=763665 RepID=A0A2G5B707_COERN|nr:RecF/RecN/SMC protein [Coemansia reversa NRRL 1564]|eukprot:PIA14795.1 RecF/RecN/SMC protein [Coemansia reversa NRRL 1564]